jgi:hypothetical protein
MSLETLATDRASATAPELFGRHGYLVAPQSIEPALAEQVSNTPNGYA